MDTLFIDYICLFFKKFFIPKAAFIYPLDSKTCHLEVWHFGSYPSWLTRADRHGAVAIHEEIAKELQKITLWVLNNPNNNNKITGIQTSDALHRKEDLRTSWFKETKQGTTETSR